MPTYNDNVLPNTTGLDLGASNQLWDAFIRNLNVTTLVSNSVNPSQSGMIRLAAQDTATIRNFANTQDLNLFSKNVSDVLALGGSAGLSASGPVTIGGNLSVTGNASITGTLQNAGGVTMGITLKKGTGGGNYVSSSTSYVDVDATNLSYTVTIPTGWKLSVTAHGTVFQSTAAVSISVALYDTASSAVVSEIAASPFDISKSVPWGLGYVITGDAASHTVKLQYKTGSASDAANMVNTSTTATPTMIFTLMPSS